MVYLTVAVVADFNVTDETLADDCEPIADMAPIAWANFCPFCSRAIRSDVGVDPAKNFSQLALIVEIDAALDPFAPGDPAVFPDAAVAGLEAGADVDEPEVGVVLLEQAVIAAASTRPKAGTSIAFGRSRWNRTGLRLPRSAD
jgi:hypothetical protein